MSHGPTLAMPLPSLEAFRNAVDRYIEWLRMNRGRSAATTVKYRGHLERFGLWVVEPPKELRLAPEQTRDPLQPTSQDLERFAGIYAHSLKLTARARRPMVSALRGFFAWYATNTGKLNPAAVLPQPRAGRALPRAMSLAQAERLLMQPDIATLQGVRDACILMLFMGCGFRLRGLASLNESALQWLTDESSRDYLVIRVVEKGDNERLVPVPAEAAILLRAYLGHEDLASIPRDLPNGDRVLFITRNNHSVPAADYYGERRRISATYIQQMMLKHCADAGLPRSVAHPHALRHLFGTELLESDVDLRDSQALMGHSDIQSTTIYTHVAHRRLRRELERANPLGKMRGPLLDSLRSLDRAVSGQRAIPASAAGVQKSKSRNRDTVR